MNTFWETIALYNSATWVYQLVIVFLGILFTMMLILRNNSRSKIVMKVYLIAVYLWISIIYYHIYCDERSYNDITALFWGVMAIAWIWDLCTGYTTFEYNPKYKILAYILILMPFLYPVFSLLRGMNYPQITSPVMPCSVATFTIGLLLLYSRKVNLFLVLLLCHWSLIGLTKTYYFRIPEDFILASASVPALYLFFKEYFLRDLHKETKPEVKYINTLLILVCLLIGIALTYTLFFEYLRDV